MSDDAKFAEAYQALGKYFSEFSALERELGEAVKAVLNLQGHDAADIVVAALRFPAIKADLVKDAVAVAKNADGTETSEEWKAKAKKTLGEILSHNENSRNPLAHWHLEPQEDGSIKLAPRKQPTDQKTWNLKHNIEEVLRLTEQLRTITHDLTTLKIRIPDLPDYWLRADAYQPRQHLEVAFGQGARALQLTEAEGKEVQG